MRVGGICRDLRAERIDIADLRGLALQLERRPRARHGCALGLGGRHQRQSLLGAGKVAGLDVALGQARERLRVLTVVLQDLAKGLSRLVKIAGGKSRLRVFELGLRLAAAIADESPNEGVHAGLRQRPHKSVDGLSILEREHRRDGLHAHLAGNLRMLVDIELDQPDGPFARAHGLLEDRGELTAGAAPRRPEIDQHRHFARGLDDIAHEVRRGGVFDEIGVRRACTALLQDRSVDAHSACPLAALKIVPPARKMGRAARFGKRGARLSLRERSRAHARRPR